MLARLSIILRATKDAQGDAVKTAGSFTNQMKRLRAQLVKMAIVFGRELLPVLKPFVKKLGDLIKRFTKLNPETKRTILIVAGLVAATGPLLIIVGTLANGLGVVIAVFAKLPVVLGLAGAALGKMGVLIGTVAAALSKLVVFLVANPIGILLLASAAAIALWIKNWEEIKQLPRELRLAWTDFIQWLGGALDRLWNRITKGARRVKRFLGITTPSPGAGAGPIRAFRPLSREARAALRIPRPAIGRGGGANVSVNSPITVNMSTTAAGTTAQDVGTAVRTAVRKEIVSMIRPALAGA